MKIRSAFVLLTIFTAVCAAQERMAENLRKGVVEEESKHNLTAAIQDYQSALTQFDEARQTAATALFRMAECYRKLGKDDQAAAAYKRVAHEFADQIKLAEQSRSVLASTYKVAAAEKPSSKAQDDARQAYRNTLVQEVALAEKELSHYQELYELGTISSSEIDQVKLQWVRAQRQLAAFDAGMLPDGTMLPKK
jgi:tetratricopeptide (TPR) repeat protein